MNNFIIKTFEKQLEKQFEKILRPEYPNLNIKKIVAFWTKILKGFLKFTSGTVLILTFTWYLPTYANMQTTTIITILLCIAIIMLREIKEQFE